MGKFGVRDLLLLTAVVGLTIGIFLSRRSELFLRVENDLLESRLRTVQNDNDRLRTDILSSRSKITEHETCDDMFARGVVLMKMKRNAEAAACFMVVVKRRPNDIGALEKLVSSFESLGDVRKSDVYRGLLDELLIEKGFLQIEENMEGQ